MIREKIVNLLESALSPRESALVEVFAPENEKFGHYSTNLALKLAKILKKNPMEIAENIKNQIFSLREISRRETKIKNNIIERIEVAPPGFINFWLTPETFQEELKGILKRKGDYGKSQIAKSKSQKIQIEFISANPTGPLTVGNGRGAFLGDVLANILKFQGNKVIREYYINDAKTCAQVKELGRTALGQGTTYKTKNLELRIKNLESKLKKIKDYGEAGQLLAEEIQRDNQQFIEKKLKIKFNKWFSEEGLYKNNAISKTLQRLRNKKLVYSADGALWFKSKDFGDEKDRVLIRQTGEESYFLPDLTYHLNKFENRKFDKVIDIWGADHHGYAPRIRAGLKAFKIPEDKLTIIITQLVRLVQSGKEVRMSKRKGEYLTLEDLINEIGLDAGRFFFLMYSPDTHMDFDLDLAKEKSLKNPVYYVQYAAVRCQSILRKSEINIRTSDVQELKLLNTAEDIALIRLLARFPEVIEEAAKNYNPQSLVRYSLNLAKEFHNFYEKERVVMEDKSITSARLALISATLTVFKNIFKIIGISLPEKM